MDKQCHHAAIRGNLVWLQLVKHGRLLLTQSSFLDAGLSTAMVRQHAIKGCAAALTAVSHCHTAVPATSPREGPLPLAYCVNVLFIGQVTDAVHKGDGIYMDIALGELRNLRYQVAAHAACAGQFGVPTGRVRVLSIGARHGEMVHTYPVPSHQVRGSALTAAEAPSLLALALIRSVQVYRSMTSLAIARCLTHSVLTQGTWCALLQVCEFKTGVAQKLESCYLYEEHVSVLHKEDVRAAHMHSAVVTHAVVTRAVVTRAVVTRAVVIHAVVTRAVVTHTMSILRPPVPYSKSEDVHS